MSDPNVLDTKGGRKTKTKAKSYSMKKDLQTNVRIVRSMRLKKSYIAIFCVIFTATQLWFGIGGMGLEFKGSPLLMAPFRLYFFNWLLLLYAAFEANSGRRILYLATIFTHYAITIAFVIAEVDRYHAAPSDEQGLGHLLRYYPDQLAFGAITYLFGNLFIWFVLVNRTLTRDEFDGN